MMKPILIAIATTLALSAPVAPAFAQAPENSPSTNMDTSGNHNGSMEAAKPGSVNEKVPKRTVHPRVRHHKAKAVH